MNSSAGGSDRDTRTVYVTSGASANPDFILIPDATAFDVDNITVFVAALAGDYLDTGTVTLSGLGKGPSCCCGKMPVISRGQELCRDGLSFN